VNNHASTGINPAVGRCFAAQEKGYKMKTRKKIKEKKRVRERGR